MIIVPPAVEVVMMSGVVLFSLLGSKEIRMNRFIYSNSYSANLTEKKEGGFCKKSQILLVDYLLPLY